MSKNLKAAQKLASDLKRESTAVSKAINKTANAEHFAAAIVQQLDDLSVRRQEWEATDYKKANEGLYALLADCLNILLERFLKGSHNEQKALRQSLVQRLQADGIRVVKTTTTLTMLTRYVFNSDRKRAQGYGYVLAAAVSHGIKPTDFAAWVVEQGGIEEIKRKMVKSAAAQARQAAMAQATTAVMGDLELNALQPLAHVSIGGLTGNYAVLLAKPNVMGGADIIGSLGDVSDGLVKALILRMAKEHVKTAEENKALGVAVAKEHSDLMASANDPQHRLLAHA